MPFESSDPLKTGRKMFDLIKSSFSPGDMPQAILVNKDDEVTMLAIDNHFFTSRETRVALYRMVEEKKAEINALLFVLVSDAWTLKNENREKFKSDPPPPGANVEWMANHGYGELQDVLHATVQCELGAWIISQKYDIVDGAASFVGEVHVGEAQVSSYVALWPACAKAAQKV
jgi:hypothetical protein